MNVYVVESGSWYEGGNVIAVFSEEQPAIDFALKQRAHSGPWQPHEEDAEPNKKTWLSGGVWSVSVTKFKVQ